MKEKLFYVLLGAVLFMAGALLRPGIGTKAEAAPERQRWEYLIDTKVGSTLGGRGCDSKKLYDSRANVLGKLGWELVMHVERYDKPFSDTMTGSCYQDYIYKRPM